MKQQFNVSLDPQLIRRIKHRSIDEQLSLSDLVGRVLSGYLDSKPDYQDSNTDHPDRRSEMSTPDSTPDSAPDLILQPIVHVRQMAAGVEFLEALGGKVVQGSRDGDWVQVSIGGAEIGLLGHPANPEQGEGDVELTFESRTRLEDVERTARAAGIEIVTPTSDEGFGRQLQLRSPDGLLVKINEIDPELFG